jgi:hypothetical protein
VGPFVFDDIMAPVIARKPSYLLMLANRLPADYFFVGLRFSGG